MRERPKPVNEQVTTKRSFGEASPDGAKLQTFPYCGMNMPRLVKRYSIACGLT